jgi:RNA polymerase sigma-70 factor (sigma-E family)
MAARRRTEAVTGFQDLVASRWASLFRTAHLVIGDHQLAQDLVQEALAKTYVAWPRLRDVGSAEAYARRVIVTTAISWRRRRSFQERPAAALPEAVGPAAADLADSVAVHADLWVELHLLPPRQRTAVVLRYCEDLSEAQTAELMGCSTGSVKRHAFLGLAKLRDRLGARFPLLVQDAPEVIP